MNYYECPPKAKSFRGRKRIALPVLLENEMPSRQKMPRKFANRTERERAIERERERAILQ